MPRLRFLRPSTGLGLEKRGIHPPIWPFIGRFYYLRLFAWLLPALISASLDHKGLHWKEFRRAEIIKYLEEKWIDFLAMLLALAALLISLIK